MPGLQRTSRGRVRCGAASGVEVVARPTGPSGLAPSPRPPNATDDPRHGAAEATTQTEERDQELRPEKATTEGQREPVAEDPAEAAADGPQDDAPEPISDQNRHEAGDDG